MASFDLYISKLDENIQEYKKNKKICMENIEYCYSVLENVDVSWSDHNVETFMNNIKVDQRLVKEYYACMDKLYNEVETFRNNIVEILRKCGCGGSINSLSYDNSRIRNCINFIEDSIYYVNQAIKRMLSIVYPSDFEPFDLVNNVLRRLYDLNSNVNSSKSNISNLSNYIVNEVSNSRTRTSRIESFNSKFKTFNYNWSNIGMDLDISKLSVDDEAEKIAHTGSLKNEHDLEITGLDDNVILKGSKIGNLEMEDTSEIEGLHDGYTERSSKFAALEKTDDAEVDSLNDNVVYRTDNANNTINEVSTSIGELNDSIEKKESRNVSFEKGNIGNSLEDTVKIDSVSSTDSSAGQLKNKVSDNFGGEKLGDIKAYNGISNSPQMDVKSVSDINLSDGIKIADSLSHSNFDTQSSGTYDVSSNIQKAAEIDTKNLSIIDKN